MSTANVGNDNGILPRGTIVYKKCLSAEEYNHTRSRNDERHASHVIVELMVLEDGVVPRSERKPLVAGISFQKRKCRVPKAYVTRIIDVRDTEATSKRRVAYSIYRSRIRPFKYEVGKVVAPERRFSKTTISTCTSGIHVYRTLVEALRH